MIMWLGLGFCIGFSVANTFYCKEHTEVKPEEVKIKKSLEYTVIDYDSVEWSDGRRDTFDWHYLYKDIANEK